MNKQENSLSFVINESAIKLKISESPAGQQES